MHKGYGWGALIRASLVLLFFVSFASPSFAITLIISDFDDTIVETRQSRDGTFETMFKLFRIEHRSNTLQDEPEGPRVIEVTPQEFERIKADLGRGNWDPGNITKNAHLKSGITIQPGNYMIVDPDTYERFNPIVGHNPLLEDFIAAETRDPSGKWKGPFWDVMTYALSDSELAKSFGVLTARGHDKKDWVEFFAYLKEKGYIQNVPTNLELFHNVSRPEYNRFNIKGDISSLKVAVMRETLMRLIRAPLGERDERLSPDNNSIERMHYVVFADDNQKTLEMMADLFREVAQGKQIPVKLALFNIGTETQVKESGRPRYSVVESGGKFRRATSREILGEPTLMSETQAEEFLANPAAYCNSKLTGRAAPKKGAKE